MKSRLQCGYEDAEKWNPCHTKLKIPCGANSRHRGMLHEARALKPVRNHIVIAYARATGLNICPLLISFVGIFLWLCATPPFCTIWPAQCYLILEGHFTKHHSSGIVMRLRGDFGYFGWVGVVSIMGTLRFGLEELIIIWQSCLQGQETGHCDLSLKCAPANLYLEC